MMKRILNLPRIQKQVIAASTDFIALPLIFCLAIALRYDTFNFQLVLHYFWIIAAVPLISIPIFIRLGLYRAVIRFIDQKIIYTVVLGVSISVIVLVACTAIATHMVGISRGVFGIYWAGAITYIATSRFLVRSYLLNVTGGRNSKNVAIYGVGQAGAQLASALRNAPEYKIVAFVDEKREAAGTLISGAKVYAPEELPSLVEKKGIKEIFLAKSSLTKSEQKRILERLESLKVKIKITPPMESLIRGELRVQDVRDIEIEDLLGRDAVAPDIQLISSCISGKSVMVTGAGGSIGSELCRQIMLFRPSRLLLLDISEFALYSIEQELRTLQHAIGSGSELIPLLGSVLDQRKCEKILGTFEVETLYHAAAYKHVPLVEHNPIEGIRNNVFGTLSIARSAINAGVSTFVLISTDKAVRPTNVMGASKRLAELVLQAFTHQSHRTRFCMVRFGNVLDSSGSVVPLFRRQIMAGGPITLTHPEITRYFMTIPEAAQLVLQAGAMGEGGDVFVLDMGEPVKILDLAKRMVHLSGLEVKSDATPEGTIEIKHVGLRPGEKLYEELLISENVEGTAHPLIMRAQEGELPMSILQGFLSKLEDACNQFDQEEIRRLLLLIVTEYAPQCGIQDFVWDRQNNGRQKMNESSVH